MKTIEFTAYGAPNGQPTWTDIPGFEGAYQASTDGNIRRHPSSKPIGNVIPGRVLRPSKSTEYPRVTMCYKEYFVHRLVALTFLGESIGKQVNHINGNKHDNRLENLEWVTPKQNYAHAIRTGLAPLGERNGSRTKPESRPRGESNTQSLLNEGQVIEIRNLRSEGLTLAEIASRYNVCFQTVHHITTGKTWKHLIGTQSI